MSRAPVVIRPAEFAAALDRLWPPGDPDNIPPGAPGEYEEARDAGVQRLGEWVVPVDDGTTGWDLRDVARCVIRKLPDLLELRGRKLTVDHVHGAARMLRDLANELDVLAEQAAIAGKGDAP